MIKEEEEEIIEEIIDGFIELKIVMLTPGSEGLSAADIQNNRCQEENNKL